MEKTDLLKKANTLPKSSGCYLMLNKFKDIIYIGKAKSLKNRVSSYFNQSEKSAKTNVLVGHITDFDFILTNSEAESFILENNLIKKHSPKYNIRLKDDKAYPYLQVNWNEEYPRIEFKRKPKKAKGIQTFGPFPTGSNLSQALKVINKSFALRDCSLTDFKSRKVPCLLYQMKQCSAPCVFDISKDDYLTDFSMGLNYFKDQKSLSKSRQYLEQKMFEHSDKEEFERAAFLRDSLKFLEDFDQKRFKQSVELQNEVDVDIISYSLEDEQVHICMYLIRFGNLIGQKHFSFLRNDLIDQLESEILRYIVQYYTGLEEDPPSKIYIHNMNYEKETLQKTFDHHFEKGRVSLTKSNHFSRLGIMAMNSAIENARVKKENQDSPYIGLKKLQSLLGLKERPRVLECYDVAIWQGKSPTASQIHFFEGKADKSKYRYYALEEREEGNNDFAMMQEVLSRRLKYKKYPDVFVIDGGLGQVNSVKKVLNDNDIDIPVIGIAKAKDLKIRNSKDVKSTEERLIIPGRSNPYILKKNKSLFRIIVQMRDEAHRFSRRLHHKKEHERLLKSWVDEIKGLSQNQRLSIRSKQKSSIKELKYFDLQRIKDEFDINDSVAGKILSYLKKLN